MQNDRQDTQTATKKGKNTKRDKKKLKHMKSKENK